MEKERNTIITKETLIPIGFLIVLMGGVVWITSLYNLAQNNARTITSLEARIAQIQVESGSFSTQIAGMNAKLDFLIEKSK